jgi:hypothetical protein
MGAKDPNTPHGFVLQLVVLVLAAVTLLLLSKLGNVLKPRFKPEGSLLVVLELEPGWLKEEDEEEGFLFLREPPPTGTLRRDPPSVQYRRHALQKYRGWVRL